MEDEVLEVVSSNGEVASLPKKMARILLDDGWQLIMLPVETGNAPASPINADKTADTEE